MMQRASRGKVAIALAETLANGFFGFKGVGAKFELQGDAINLSVKEDFQLRQIMCILRLKIATREIDVGCLKVGEPTVTGSTARLIVQLRQSIDQKLAKSLVKHVEEQEMKVQSAI